MLVAAGLTLAATVLFTLAPLGGLFRTLAHDALRIASRSAIGERRQHRLRDGLVVAEIASALVLLLATTLLVRDVANLERVAPGFTRDGVFQARVTLPPTYRSPADVARFHDQLMARLTTVHGVHNVGMISAAPLSGLLVTVPFSVAGDTNDRASGVRPNTNFRVITPNYLSAAGTQLLRGRGFTDQDRAETSKVALVSAAFAERWLGGEPLGRQVLISDNNTGPRAVEVVGVVET